MIIRWQHGVADDYKSLPPAIQKKADKAFRLFDRNPWHPSLHTEKIDHKRDIWSARVDRSYRFTFHWITGGVLVRRIAAHQQAYRRP